MSHASWRRRPARWLAGLALAAAVSVVGLSAQQDAAAPPSARSNALIDVTGQWVSVVNEDWRWRMVTPPRGDTASVPLNAAGRDAANAWDLDADRAAGALCKAFGPPSLIRQPGRVRIDWEDDNTLALEFDAGMQTRRFHFDEAPAPAARTRQGHSLASWNRQRQTRGFFGLVGQQFTGGSLAVVTTNLEAGYLRPNGVPYSEGTVVQEFFDTFTLEDAGTWLIVTTVINDPTYLTQEFILSTQFRKETDLSGWAPRPCEIPAPVQ